MADLLPLIKLDDKKLFMFSHEMTQIIIDLIAFDKKIHKKNKRLKQLINISFVKYPISISKFIRDKYIYPSLLNNVNRNNMYNVGNILHSMNEILLLLINYVDVPYKANYIFNTFHQIIKHHNFLSKYHNMSYKFIQEPKFNNLKKILNNFEDEIIIFNKIFKKNKNNLSDQNRINHEITMILIKIFIYNINTIYNFHLMKDDS